jgi:cell wall-associated NlpC family hydrolase
MIKSPFALILLAYIYAGFSCSPAGTNRNNEPSLLTDSVATLPSKETIAKVQPPPLSDNTINKDTVVIPPSKSINAGTVQPDEVVKFAESLFGTPYVYASTNPKVGFDCSGFITYVFNHFNISVPRSSVDFTNVGKTVSVTEAKRGDIILFTGTNPAERQVGHMGIVVSSLGDSLNFIHSSSGKAMGVTITPLNDYYKGRFVRICRIFLQNN